MPFSNEDEAILDRLFKMLRATFGSGGETKTEDGLDFPASAYAYVPDPKEPSTWKLRLWESPEAKETSAQVGRSVAALGKGFRGNKVSIPSGDREGVIA